MTDRRFSAKEKVILHLFLQRGHFEEYTLPPVMTQQGMAEILELQRPHVSMVLKDLKTVGTVVERTAHVDGAARMKKVYTLTPFGVEAAKELAKCLLDKDKKGLDHAIRNMIHKVEEPKEIETIEETKDVEEEAIEEKIVEEPLQPKEPPVIPSPEPILVFHPLPPTPPSGIPFGWFMVALSFALSLLGGYFVFSSIQQGELAFLMPAVVLFGIVLFLVYFADPMHGNLGQSHGIAMVLGFVSSPYLTNGFDEMSILSIGALWTAIIILAVEKKMPLSFRSSLIISIGTLTFFLSLASIFFDWLAWDRWIDTNTSFIWLTSGIAFFAIGHKISGADNIRLSLPDLLFGSGLALLAMSFSGAIGFDNIFQIVAILWALPGFVMCMIRFSGDLLGEGTEALVVAARLTVAGIFVVLGLVIFSGGELVSALVITGVGLLVALGTWEDIKETPATMFLLSLSLMVASGATIYSLLW